MNQKFRKAGSYAILGTMLLGLLTFGPTVIDAISSIFKLGGTYSTLHAKVEEHDSLIKSFKTKIESTDEKVREFRSVWCMERLGTPDKLSNEVLKACSSWIHNP